MRNRLPGFREVFRNKRGKRKGVTPLRKCIKCGTLNDTRKTSWSNSGDGLVRTEEKTGASTFEVYEHPIDEKAGSGCRFCGSLMWQSQKPIKLPDDKDFPATGYRRRRR